MSGYCLVLIEAKISLSSYSMEKMAFGTQQNWRGVLTFEKYGY